MEPGYVFCSQKKKNHRAESHRVGEKVLVSYVDVKVTKNKKKLEVGRGILGTQYGRCYPLVVSKF